MFTARLMSDNEVVGEPPMITVAGNEDPARPSAGVIIGREELSSLPELIRTQWPEADISRQLVEHVARDGLGSRLITGETPETWSPLGDIGVGDDVASFGVGPIDEPGSMWVRLGAVTGAGAQGVEFLTGQEVVAALVYGQDAVIMLVRPGDETIEFESGPDNQADKLLSTAVPGGDIDELMVWRLYTGGNTWVRDWISHAARGVHRVALSALRGAGVLVGRPVRVIANRLRGTSKDPTAALRRRWAERHRRSLTTSCPAINTVIKKVDRAVVVVHGTMATGLPLADLVRTQADKAVVVRRFEHDTWLPIEDNARELAVFVRQQITEKVLFVAHSRGGLVVRNAMEILRAEGCALELEAITMGTPFHGTPMAGSAKVAFLGVNALLGGLRWAGGWMVDGITRLAGLAIKTKAPQGLTDMSPGPGYLSGFKLRPPGSTYTFAGAVTDGADAYGLSFLHGFSSELLGNDPHDLVVPTASAAGDAPASTTLTCDHFSYFEQQLVLDAISKATRRLIPAGIRTRRNQEELRRKAPRLRLRP